MAAGGAGPLHAASVGRMLNCHKAYVPRLSGAYCALGMLHANVRHDLVRLHLQVLDESDPGGLLAVYRALEGEAREALSEGGFEEVPDGLPLRDGPALSGTAMGYPGGG